MNVHPKPITKDKGKKGKNCNVTHCQKPDSAHFYNNAKCTWYCYECATDIEESAQLQRMSFFDDL